MSPGTIWGLFWQRQAREVLKNHEKHYRWTNQNGVAATSHTLCALCAVDVRREAERGCGDVKKRCGAVAPQELPLIVGGQNASQSARVQRKRRDVSCLTTFLGNGCPSWFVKKDTFELTSGEQWPQRGYVHLRLVGAATDVFFNLGVGPAPGCCCCHPQGPHAWCNASPFPNLGAPPRKQWDREFYRLATVLPVCPVSDLDGMRVVW